MRKKIYKNDTFKYIKSTKRRLVLAFSFLLLFGILFWNLLPSNSTFKTTAKKLFSGNNPVSSVEIKTDDYDNDGSIKLTKEAHWISKTEAELDLKLETIRKTGDNKKDIVLVFDVSGSMEGEKLEKVKEDASELINYVLDKDEDNKVGLITFASESRIISPLTNNKEELFEIINSISTEDSTNYYLAYKSIEEILSDYNKETGKDLVVLFMTDGSPTENAGATKGVYESLKEQHPYMTLNAVEYEKGKSTSDTQDISDGQWIANMNTLNNVLFEATVSPEPYEKLKVIDYIDNEYFDIETNTPSKGNVVVDNNKITWRFTSNSYITGSEETLKVRLKLKEQYQNIKGLFPTNKKTEIEYKIDNEKEKSSTLTPILKNNYDVIYDINTPENCTLEDPEGENHFIYDTVTIKNIEPKCTGYQLKGWQIEERDIKYKSEDKFIMPEHDVHVKAIWARQTMKAYMDGTVHEKTTLYKEIASQAENSEYVVEYTGEHADAYDRSGTEKIYHYATTATNKNVANQQAEVILNKFNVIFGGFCWQILRTTDTGGVKLIYNGIPDSSGTCNNTGTAQQIGIERFNISENSPAYLGYMYNEVIPNGDYTLNTSTSLFKNFSLNKTHYYSKYYNYNQSISNRYKLQDSSDTEEDDRFTAEECVINNNCNDILTGTYTFSSSNTEYTNTIIKYVVGVVGEKVYYIEIKNGQTLNDVNPIMYIGDEYIDNGDGTYAIQESEQGQALNFKTEKWFSKYSGLKNKYLCIGSNPCTNPEYITITYVESYKSEKIENNFIYGNDFDYVLNEATGEYEYVLKDTDFANKMQFWDWVSNYNKVYSNHYTCTNTTGVCQTLKYIFYTYSDNFKYINLNNGNNINDALNLMLFDDNVNNKESVAKTKLELWYQNNLEFYSNYLEDTVWCNSRKINNLAGFNPNGGSGMMTFGTNSLKCSYETDRFSLLNEKAKINYPVGLATYGEINMLNNNLLRKTGQNYWTLSPASNWQWAHTNIYTVDTTGLVSSRGNTYTEYGLRPVVSLKPGIEYVSGDGSKNNPYVIDSSEVESP